MKASEQYFPVVLFTMLYKLALTFESVNKILWCDHSNEMRGMEDGSRRPGGGGVPQVLPF